MENAPIPENEDKRLDAVRKLAILDTNAEERFDVITRLATKLFNVPISTLTIMDAEREWFKSCQGVSGKESPRAISFCGHVVASEDDMLIIPDAKLDTRFSDNSMVTGSPYIRFYAGVPIFSLTGERVGVLCIKDTKPKSLSDADSFLLQTLASWAELEINIISLKKILNDGNSKEELKPLMERLSHRRVLENLKSIKLGLRLKAKEDNVKEAIESEKAIKQAEELVEKIQTSSSSQ